MAISPVNIRAGSAIQARLIDDMIAEIRANRIIPSPEVGVSRGVNGTLLKINAGDGGKSSQDELKPWTVRWFKTGEEEEEGEWQVYAPAGSLVTKYGTGSAVRKTYVGKLVNTESEDDGGGEGTGCWYTIPEPEDEDADMRLATDEKMGGKSWVVYVLVKPWSRAKVSTKKLDYDDVAWVEPIAEICVGEYEEKKEEGEGGEAETHIVHDVRQIYTGSLNYMWDQSAPFALDYTLEDEKEIDTDVSVTVINQTKMLGRLQKANIDPVDVTGEESVWVKIKHSSSEFVLSIETEDPGDSNDDQTCYKIFEMKDNVVKWDGRAYIGDLPFYTNPADVGNDDGEGGSAGTADQS